MLAAMICRWMTGGYPTICIIKGVTHRLLERHKQIHMAFWGNPDDSPHRYISHFPVQQTSAGFLIECFNWSVKCCFGGSDQVLAADRSMWQL